MPRILLTSGPDDWQKMLADPEKHWRSGYSARTAFIRLFGVQAVGDVLQCLTSAQKIPLFAAWVTGDCSFLKS